MLDRSRHAAPRRWFSFCDEEGMRYHDSPEAARAHAEAQIECCRESADHDGWPDDVHTIVWGEVQKRTAPVTDDDGAVSDYALVDMPNDAAAVEMLVRIPFDERLEVSPVRYCPVCAVAPSAAEKPVLTPLRWYPELDGTYRYKEMVCRNKHIVGAGRV